MVAITTAHRVNSISTIGLSGERALEIALKLSKEGKLYPCHATFTKLFNRKSKFLDETIAVYFKAPFGFADEGIVELQVHGGFSISEISSEESTNLGAKLTKPGGFSKRACLGSKMSPLKALDIQGLVLTKSAGAAEIIARNIRGSLGELLDKIHTDLVRTLAFVETNADYADDDLPSDLLEQISAMCGEDSKILKEIHTLSEDKGGLVEGFKAAIVGEPGVGKSSFLNALLSCKRTIASDIARTTRDTIKGSFKLDTHLLRITDTAGIRESKNEIEQIGIELSRKSIENTDVTLAVFDSSRKEDEEDEGILKLLSQSNKKIFYFLNKSDLKTQFDKPCDTDSTKLSTQNDI